MSWEGETANRTSGLVTALINLPLGHKSPALHSLFSPQPPSLRNREGAVAASFLSKSPSQPQWKHRTQLYVCVCIYTRSSLTKNLHNRVAWMVSFISNIPVSHSTMMTDYKVFYLDYVPDENTI